MASDSLDPENLQPNRVQERVEQLGRALMQALPGGGTAAAILSMAVAEPAARRAETFMVELAKRLIRLESRFEGFQIDSLASKPEFASAVLQAVTLAQRAHQDEKRLALLNSVLNTAVSRDAGQEFEVVVLSLLDSMTTSHLRILRWLADNPLHLMLDRGRGLAQHAAEQFPDFKSSPGMVEFVAGDLISKGLVDKTNPFESDTTAYAVSEFGARFLRFISEPQPKELTAG